MSPKLGADESAAAGINTRAHPVIALAGSPNTGKTTVFNSLTGLRARTSNYPGTTVEKKSGPLRLGDQIAEVMDLPGIYSLDGVTPEERVACDMLRGADGAVVADLVVVIADADNLERSLFVVSQLLEMGRPIVVALNMMDVAERHGRHVDPDALSTQLGCPVVPLVARTGQGVAELRAVIRERLQGEAIAFSPSFESAACTVCGGCPYQARYGWSDDVVSRCVKSPTVARTRRTEQIDRILTRPVVGLMAFLLVMLGVFYLIFSGASIPMDLIDGFFADLGAGISARMSEGNFQSFIVDGVIAGVGGVLVFLPQICILFFFLALLEDSGYLARAAFVMDRLMRRIGLPGTAFVPLLSAHACAIPAIMSTRVIRDPRDRLVTILVAPLMTCSARIPVYAMITALLFPRSPGKAALLFAGAYALGIGAALLMSFLFKKTILPGESKPLVLELPGYRIPRLRTVLLFTVDRAKVFVTQAGTVILLISMALWVLATYPQTETPSPEAAALRAQAEMLEARGDTEGADELLMKAEGLAGQHALAHSFAGRIGRFIEPVVRPLGYDWRIGIGIITSFAAREVVVSTLAIVYGLGEDAAEEDTHSLYDALRRATHDDGRPVFTVPTSISLLVFFVLAMQCLPTQAATYRETNGWKWPLFQLAYMTVLAYGAAFIAYQGLRAWGL